jgi:hypothetical protein
LPAVYRAVTHDTGGANGLQRSKRAPAAPVCPGR